MELYPKFTFLNSISPLATVVNAISEFLMSDSSFNNSPILLAEALDNVIETNVYRFLDLYTQNIEKDAFGEYDNLKEVYYDGTMGDWCKINFNSMRDNPFYWNKEAVMYILVDGDYQKMTVLDIPEGVTEVNKYAFAGFRFIERINIPKSLTLINESGFYILNDCQDFYYAGTPEDWSKITFKDSNANPMGYFKNQYFLNDNHEYQKITELDLRNLSEIKSNTFIYMPDVTKLYLKR